jgi:hypothetical protein
VIRQMATVVFSGFLLAGCSLDLFGSGMASGPGGTSTATARLSTREPVLTNEGVCDADASLDPSSLRQRPAEIGLGITECDLVKLKGKPTDVLIGESGKGQREAQVLYSEPTGREIYLFTDNRLARIVKPGQG